MIVVVEAQSEVESSFDGESLVVINCLRVIAAKEGFVK